MSVPEDEYGEFHIKEYQDWQLYLHKDQFGALGRTYLWAKRDKAESFTAATSEELVEFLTATRQVEQALERTFMTDRLNVEFLGNETHHLHGHLIPRYSAPREFAGVTFTDSNWGSRFVPVRNQDLPMEVLLKIRNRLRQELG